MFINDLLPGFQGLDVRLAKPDRFLKTCPGIKMDSLLALMGEKIKSPDESGLFIATYSRNYHY